MLVAIGNTPRDYAWGSDGEISRLLGVEPTGAPEAELWLGAHPGSPSRILHPESVGGAADLAAWIASDAPTALGEHPRLPFLLKVLAAGAPLSLQAHPTAEQAREGYARENALGVPLDAPHRNYKDEYPKPEIIYALSERFDALCGFRAVDATLALLRQLGLDDLAGRLERDGLRTVVEWLVRRGPGVDALVARVSALGAPAAGAVPKTKEIPGDTPHGGAGAAQNGSNSFFLGGVVESRLAEGGTVDNHAAANRADDADLARDTIRMLAAQYPGDPGIVVALLLNRVALSPGEALYLPAGNIHAYLGGVGIELMTASDNVLRGGLTPKHVDVDELLHVLDFTPTPVPYLRPRVEGGAHEYRPDGPGFTLIRVGGEATRELHGPAIVLCTSGTVNVTGAKTHATLRRGDAVYATPDETTLTFSGSGEAFVATTSL